MCHFTEYREKRKKVCVTLLSKKLGGDNKGYLSNRRVIFDEENKMKWADCCVLGVI